MRVQYLDSWLTYNWICNYDYVDERGRIMFQKRRLELSVADRMKFPDAKSKKMWQYARLNPRGVWYLKREIEARYPTARSYFAGLLFNLPLLLTGPSRIALTEGEKDAQAVTAAGVAALSHWGGAGHFTEEQAWRFRDFAGLILLVADDDGPGYADVVRRYDRLRAVGIATGQLRPLLPRAGKDATDALEKLPLRQALRRVPIEDLRDRAEAWTPPTTNSGRGTDGGYAPGAFFDAGHAHPAYDAMVEARLARQAQTVLKRERLKSGDAHKRKGGSA